MERKANKKTLLFGLFIPVMLGILFGYLINYLYALDHPLPTTIQEYTQNQGIAGARSGIVGGILGFIIPRILIPTLLKIKPIKRFFDWLATLFRIQ